MISNSKSLALTILASSLMFSVNAAAITPARFACQGHHRAAVPATATTNEKRFDDPITSLCNTIRGDLENIVQKFIGQDNEANGVTNAENVIFGLKVICSGSNGTPNAQSIATTDDTTINQPGADVPDGGIDAQAITDAQTVANADANLATDEANACATNAVQDVCNSIQEFIDTDCNDPTVCPMIASTVNDDCINAIAAASPTSSNR